MAASYTKLVRSPSEIELASEEDAADGPQPPSDATAKSSWCSLLAVLDQLGFATSGDSSTGGCDPEWQSRVDEAWWYQVSSFAYCAAGSVTLLRPEPLERHMAFPWRVMGVAVFANGFASYMADVETWGRPSPWKGIDRLLATTNSLIQVAIVVLAFCTDATFPWQSPAILGTGVLTGLACKRRAATALRDGDCDAYLRWHAAWHYTLPLGAIVGQCWLHKACDYTWGVGSGCACQH